ncbi:ABC transporter substrate-binding protein [Roseomonas nepalensis]|uniref:ABC transporter substrate-binding protein n=1 Tax=Muricoccus nepalensis TaxID=1854500 RepID=A0A502GB06_9PROT|nr:ABC transporter substrate-binding protein [Roseomonas nepalensis]TPG59014.1 ABC transporter substrate-binding protein [Roseomonas nepalensis]
MPMPSLRRLAVAALLPLLAFAAPAQATQYPVTLTDAAGREVTIARRPERVALQDGRNIAILALLDREDPFQRVVLWNNIPSRDDAGFWAVLRAAWPKAAGIPDMGFGDNGQVNAEQLITARPQLVVAEQRALGSLREAGVDRRLAQLNIPLLVVDSFADPVPNAIRSVELLGQALDREAEAADYAAFARERVARVEAGIAASGHRPNVFVETRAGQGGPEARCFTQGRVGWGPLVEAAGGHNIGADLVPGASGEVTMETVIARRPEVYVMTGANWRARGAVAVPFGYGAEAPAALAGLARLEERPGFALLEAAREGRVLGVWHGFYNHAFNVVGLEALAKAFHPRQLAGLDPDETFRTILARFTRIPPSPFLVSASAPRVGG